MGGRQVIPMHCILLSLSLFTAVLGQVAAQCVGITCLLLVPLPLPAAVKASREPPASQVATQHVQMACPLPPGPLPSFHFFWSHYEILSLNMLRVLIDTI